MTIATSTDIQTELGSGLHSGDRMKRDEFHRLYEQMPRDFRAELIGGTVYVSSPVSRPHGRAHVPMTSLLFAYELATPGTECGDNETVLMGDEAEPQPDVYLRILPEYGGQSASTRQYVKGPPELIVEIAFSSRSIDLHAKLDDYSRNGVLEYLVVLLPENALRWFDLKAGRELTIDPDGVCRVQTFPGLWIDSAALRRQDFVSLMTTGQKGLESKDHSDFVARLAAARK